MTGWKLKLCKVTIEWKVCEFCNIKDWFKWLVFRLVHQLPNDLLQRTGLMPCKTVWLQEETLLRVAASTHCRWPGSRASWQGTNWCHPPRFLQSLRPGPPWASTPETPLLWYPWSPSILDPRFSYQPVTTSHPGGRKEQSVRCHIGSSSRHGPRTFVIPSVHQRPTRPCDIRNLTLRWRLPPLQTNPFTGRHYISAVRPSKSPSMGREMANVLQPWQVWGDTHYQQAQEHLWRPILHPWDVPSHRWWGKVPWCHHSEQPQLEASHQQHQ